MQIIDLRNNNIVITGAGSGIGRETCLLLDKLGANVICLDIDKNGLEETRSGMVGQNHEQYVVDLTDEIALKEFTDDVILKKSLIHGLVHCAGISSRKPLNVLKKEGFSKIMDVNFYSFVELVKHLTKKNCFCEGGSIVVMSSISSIKGYKAKTEYCVSKAAVDSFVRCMALELASKRIRINSIMPGEVLTPMGIKAREMALLSGTDEIVNQPLGPTEPYEVANLIAFLLSQATKTITGTSVRIDGGASI
jgi:NAD(P)-dependent dehydrogenase (short-subunit alcohol dehydrogenase family)